MTSTVKFDEGAGRVLATLRTLASSRIDKAGTHPLGPASLKGQKVEAHL